MSADVQAPLTLTPARHTMGFALAMLGLVAICSQAAVPSPVYPLYSAEWQLGPLTMSVIFAIYVVGLLVTLLTAGALSDHVGRRPVALCSLGLAVVSLVVLAAAQGVGMLILGRFLQGTAMGLGIGAFGASLLDLAPPRRPRVAAMMNGSLPPFGLAMGALLGSVVVQFVYHPTRMIYVFYAAALTVVLVLLLFLPERQAPRPGAWRSLVPSVDIPAQARPVFVAVLGCMLASWALGGLYLATGASLMRTVFGYQAPIAGGLAIAAVTGTGCVIGILGQSRDALAVMVVGAVALILGAALMIVATATGHVWIFFVASVIAGVGFGGGFQGALRLVLAETPPDKRAGLLSSVYVTSYVAFGLPAIIAGILIPHLGMREVADGYAVFVMVLAGIALALQLINRLTRLPEIAADRDERLAG